MDVDALLSPEGAEVLAEVAAATGPELGLLTRLRRRFPAQLVADAIDQQRLRSSARAKFPLAERLLFTRAGLEQASSAAVASHRAERLAGLGAVADLCCGIGGDLMALALQHEVLAVDRDPVHLRLAVHNALVAVPSASVSGRCADVTALDLPEVAAVFLDPARRDGAGRRFDGDGEPPLAWCAALTDRVPAVVVKAAPAVPDDLVPAGWEAEFVAEGRDLKEATLWSPALATAPRRATVLTDGVARSLVGTDGDETLSDPLAFLLDPSPAVTRAGLVTSLAAALGAARIDERIGFLTSATEVRSPFARCLPVLDSFPWQERAVIAAVRGLGAGSVEVRRRGLAGDVDALTARLRRAIRHDEGNRRLLVAMTRVRDRPWAILCAA